MSQLVARVSASDEEMHLMLMSVSKEMTGSEKLLASRLVKAAAADPSIPVTSVAASSSKQDNVSRK